MTTLTAARNTRERLALDFSYPVLANAVVFAGSMVTLTAAGFARNGVQGGTRVVGVAQSNVNNTGGVSGAMAAPPSRLEGERTRRRERRSHTCREVIRRSLGGN